MKTIQSLTVIFVMLANLCLAQSEVQLINGQEFKIKTVTKNDTIQTEYVEIYRNNKQLIVHTLYNSEGDCSSENIELGSYEIKENSIVFYTYWASADRMGKNIYPFGFRKQIYEVSNTGALNFKDSELYIEAYTDSYIAHEGMQYLFIKPKTETEKALLKDYVLKVEKEYSGAFVFDKTKDALETEVREKLKNEIHNATNYWDEVYGKNFRK